MKLYLMFIVFLLLSFHNYEAEGIRLGKFLTSSASSNQEIIKISSMKERNQDHGMLTKTDEEHHPTGVNRKLMTKTTSSSSSTTTTIPYKNDKKDENKINQKPEIKSAHGPVGYKDNFLFYTSPEKSKLAKDIANEPCPNEIDITGMDYTPTRRKSPIHN